MRLTWVAPNRNATLGLVFVLAFAACCAVVFAQNPIDPSLPLKQPDTTYTAATFAWSASDPDGNNTLVYYRIALNDTTNPANWHDVNFPPACSIHILIFGRL